MEAAFCLSSTDCFKLLRIPLTWITSTLLISALVCCSCAIAKFAANAVETATLIDKSLNLLLIFIYIRLV